MGEIIHIDYIGHEFISFREYIEHKTRIGKLNVDSTPLYAHPVDAWIIHALNSTPVKNLISQSVDELIKYTYGHKIVNSIPINQRSFPDIFHILSHCAETLDIPIPHAVTSPDSDFFNAFTVGTDEYAYICISPDLLQFFSKDEACFVIGHECGHIASSHMVYHMLTNTIANATLGGWTAILGPIIISLTKIASAPLMAWSRRSEITADRAGLLCCGDIATGERALLRLMLRLADPNRTNIDELIHHYEVMLKFSKWSSLQEAFASHPMLPKRIQALRLFADSELYYSLSGKARPNGKELLSQDELNRRVSQIVRL